MTQEELAAVRGRLEAFAAEMLAPLIRSDQRAKGQTYLRGLLLDGTARLHQHAGIRIEPPPSVPSARGGRPSATAAALPPEEAPVFFRSA